MTIPYHKTSCDRTGSLAMTSNPVTRISPPTENTQGSSVTARETGMRMIPHLKEVEKMTSPSQAEGVECDWQTVFWRLPTPQPSNNHIVPSSAEAAVSSQTSAVSAKTSRSGLESYLAESAVTLGEKLAGEMIWGKNEDLKFPSLHLVSLLLYILLTLDCQREDQSGCSGGR
jgi:hypothetical protein